jgi:hypothetical protein
MAEKLLPVEVREDQDAPRSDLAAAIVSLVLARARKVVAERQEKKTAATANESSRPGRR